MKAPASPEMAVTLGRMPKRDGIGKPPALSLRTHVG